MTPTAGEEQGDVHFEGVLEEGPDSDLEQEEAEEEVQEDRHSMATLLQDRLLNRDHQTLRTGVVQVRSEAAAAVVHPDEADSMAKDKQEQGLSRRYSESDLPCRHNLKRKGEGKLPLRINTAAALLQALDPRATHLRRHHHRHQDTIRRQVRGLQQGECIRTTKAVDQLRRRADPRSSTRMVSLQISVTFSVAYSQPKTVLARPARHAVSVIIVTDNNNPARIRFVSKDYESENNKIQARIQKERPCRVLFVRNVKVGSINQVLVHFRAECLIADVTSHCSVRH